jgi:hypothetical protein
MIECAENRNARELCVSRLRLFHIQGQTSACNRTKMNEWGPLVDS